MEQAQAARLSWHEHATQSGCRIVIRAGGNAAGPWNICSADCRGARAGRQPARRPGPRCRRLSRRAVRRLAGRCAALAAAAAGPCVGGRARCNAIRSHLSAARSPGASLRSGAAVRGLPLAQHLDPGAIADSPVARHGVDSRRRFPCGVGLLALLRRPQTRPRWGSDRYLQLPARLSGFVCASRPARAGRRRTAGELRAHGPDRGFGLGARQHCAVRRGSRQRHDIRRVGRRCVRQLPAHLAAREGTLPQGDLGEWRSRHRLYAEAAGIAAVHPRADDRQHQAG